MPEPRIEPLFNCPRCGYPTNRLMHVLGCTDHAATPPTPTGTHRTAARHAADAVCTPPPSHTAATADGQACQYGHPSMPATCADTRPGSRRDHPPDPAILTVGDLGVRLAAEPDGLAAVVAPHEEAIALPIEADDVLTGDQVADDVLAHRYIYDISVARRQYPNVRHGVSRIHFGAERTGDDA